jgi:pre-mRNA-processing factor SLU7
MAQTQVLCWEMQSRGESIDLISNPSQAELMQRQFKEKKVLLEGSKRKSVLEKYGSGDQKVLDPRLKLGQTEVSVGLKWISVSLLFVLR